MSTGSYYNTKSPYQFKSMSLPRGLPRQRSLRMHSDSGGRRLSAAERLGIKSPPPKRAPSLSSIEGACNFYPPLFCVVFYSCTSIKFRRILSFDLFLHQISFHVKICKNLFCQRTFGEIPNCIEYTCDLIFEWKLFPGKLFYAS